MSRTMRIELYSSGSENCHRTYELIQDMIAKHCNVYCIIKIHDFTIPEVVEQAKKLGIKSVPAVVINGKLLKESIGKVPKKYAILRLISTKQPA
jgi:glutaredoxin 3